MRKRPFHRLWVRFSLAIIGIILVVTVLPTASLLLVSEQEVNRQTKAYITALDAEGNLGLSDNQINRLSETLAYETQVDSFNDTLFLLLTTVIVGVLAGGLLGRWLSLPIERLVAATKAIGSRNLAHRVAVGGAQEIEDLAHNFNQMAAELARSEQLRRSIMADVSHELLTPLTVLQGNLRAILDDVYALNKDEIGTLYEQNKHLIRLVKDLRQLAQAEAGQLPFQMAAVDLAKLAEDTAVSFLPAAAEKNIHIQRDLASNLPHVHADADRLRQVLHNLLANALRHTPDGGQITIAAQRTGDELQLSIADTGEGFPPEMQPYLFDRFYRSDRSRRRDSGGAGLGLAISKAIVAGHNGRIQAASPGINQGSTFSITLPINNSRQ